MPYSVVDLFAGAGGLSLGFMQTNKYEIKVAFENSCDMQRTYKKNHPSVEVQGDVCTANYDAIQKKYGAIDVVIGGPPCQGFSNANRQKNHAISQNNMLVKQYIRAILELKPKAFVMENVSMLKSEVHRFYMTKSDVQIVKKYGIPNKNTPLELLQADLNFDGVLSIVQDLSCIKQRLWPEKDYRELNIIYKIASNHEKLETTLQKHEAKLRKLIDKYIHIESNDYISKASQSAFLVLATYYDGKYELKNIQAAIKPAVMYQRMLSKAKEIFDNDIVVDSYTASNGVVANIKSFAVFDYLKYILQAPENDYQIQSKVLCAADFGAPQKRMRFVVMGIKRNISSKVTLPQGQYTVQHYHTVRDAISDIEEIKPVYDIADDLEGIRLPPKKDIGELAEKLRDAPVLKNHIITRTTETAMERFRVIKEGENFHSLDEGLKTNTYTNVTRTQNTIYLRLKYDEPSETVVNVRKSMWIHPRLDRAISIREAARLQTFPDSFVFCGSKDKQYQQVGNAVPPIMAKSIAKKLAQLLTEGEKMKI